MKKLVSVVFASLLVGGLAFAAAPKTSAYFVQMNGGESYDGAAAASKIYTANGHAGYSRSEVQGQAAFDLGGGLSLTPWVKERFELKEDAASPRFRNRFYAGADFAAAISPALNVVVSFEYRNAYDVKSAAAATNVFENRYTPYLTVKGAVADLYYSLTGDMPIYLDTSVGNIDNAQDNTQFEFEITANLGYNVKINDGLTIKIDLNNYTDLVQPTKVQIDTLSYKQKIGNETRDKLIFVMGDIKPFAGFLMSTTINANLVNSDAVSYNVVGTTFGTDLNAGNIAFNVTADLGWDVQNQNRFVSQVQANVKVKF